MFKLASAREMCLLVVALRNRARVSNKIRVQHKLLPPTQMGAAANVVICLYCNTALDPNKSLQEVFYHKTLKIHTSITKAAPDYCAYKTSFQPNHRKYRISANNFALSVSSL
jgi:hypothetical protein